MHVAAILVTWGLRDYGIEPVVWGGEEECPHEWGEEITTGSKGHPGDKSTLVGTQTADISKSAQNQGQFCRLCGAWRGSYGLEPTIDLYVQHTVEIFREVRRVLRKDGVLFLNLGDSYHGGGGAHKDHHANPGISKSASRNGLPKCIGKAVAFNDSPNRQLQSGLKPKDLCGIPWRVALALQADGWWLRSDIIWSKPNPMPESCTDRPTRVHEYIFLLTKSCSPTFWTHPSKSGQRTKPKPDYIWRHKDTGEIIYQDPGNKDIWKRFNQWRGHDYFWDQEAVREVSTWSSIPGTRYKSHAPNGSERPGGNRKLDKPDPHGRNLRTVWEIATAPFPQAHFATFPPELARRCIAAGTSEKGCCPKCGAPWKRLVEKIDSGKRQKMADGWDTGPGGHGTVHRNGREKGQAEIPVMQSTTTGWAPTCKCESGGPLLVEASISGGELFDKMEEHFLAKRFPEPVPCTVLDPFAGAGTTGLVAAKLGRDAVLIEIKPEYCRMSEKRGKGELGMLAQIEIIDTQEQTAV